MENGGWKGGGERRIEAQGEGERRELTFHGDELDEKRKEEKGKREEGQIDKYRLGWKGRKGGKREREREREEEVKIRDGEEEEEVCCWCVRFLPTATLRFWIED